jgi:quercetin dioxygenase-like cupin family protein
MSDAAEFDTESGSAFVLGSGQDVLGEYRGLGVSRIDFKLCGQGPTGILILENTFERKGGPPRHSHREQDEWFYAIEGDFVVEVGEDRFQLGPGESLLAPRRIPHVWAFVGEEKGRMLIVFTPAGLMEGFFREVTKANSMPPQDPQLWRSYGMELEPRG